MAGVSYINQPVSLISKASIRYEGILFSINPEEATITLSSVRSYGTEDRKVEKFLAPKETLYEYIIFKANDIKELVIDEPHNDPAIVTQGPTSSNNTFSGNAFGNENQSSLQANGLPEQQSLNGQSANAPSVSSVGQTTDRYRHASRGSTPASSQARSPVSELSSSNKQKSDLNKVVSRGENAGENFQSNGRGPNNQRRQWDQNRVNNNNNQRRAWGNNGNNYQNNGNNLNRRPGGYQNNNYQNNYNNRGNYRRNDDQRVSNPRNQGGYRNYNNNYNNNYNRNYNNQPGQMRGGPRKFVPNKGKFNDPALKTEFDFEKSNQQFLDLVDKLDELNVSTNGEKSGSEEHEARTELSKAADKVDEDGNFYDKTKSFFDNISCEAIERTKGNQKRFDWKQERKLNAETFGIKINFRQHDGTFRRGGLQGFNRNPNHQYRRYNNQQQPPRNQAPRTSSS